MQRIRVSKNELQRLKRCLKWGDIKIISQRTNYSESNIVRYLKGEYRMNLYVYSILLEVTNRNKETELYRNKKKSKFSKEISLQELIEIKRWFNQERGRMALFTIYTGFSCSILSSIFSGTYGMSIRVYDKIKEFQKEYEQPESKTRLDI